MKKFILIAVFLVIPLITVAQAGEQINAGFISGLWYSKTPFFAGEEIRIYSAIQNQSGSDITGTLRFFDNGEVIGESEFSAINGRLVEKWIDWRVSEGNHAIQVKIFDAKKSLIGGGEESISLLNDSSLVSEQFADIDTDGDGIGNLKDIDDDGDGLADGVDPQPLVFSGGTIAEVTNSFEEGSVLEEGNIEKAKESAEKFVIKPVTKVTKKALAESKPLIEKIGDILVEKSVEIEEKIAEDKQNAQNLAVAGALDLSFYKNIQEKLPPTFRILYGWLLKFLILIFSIWWIPLIILVLLVLRLLLGLYRRFRYRY